jgi:hypothetical protein
MKGLPQNQCFGVAQVCCQPSQVCEVPEGAKGSTGVF